MQQRLQYVLAAALLLGLGTVAGAVLTNPSTLQQPTGDVSENEQDGSSPYAGQQTRDIKYLASEDVEALQEGKGGALGGLAKPAELNGYPGPRHVLDLSQELNLTDEQEQEIRSLFEDMQAEAQPVGQQFLGVERKIDDAYADGAMTDEKLENLLNRSGDLYGKLRYVHLRYHFQTKEVLTEGQVQHYDALRGYTSSEPCEDVPEGMDAELHRQHMGCDA